MGRLSSDDVHRLAVELVKARLRDDDVGETAALLALEEVGDWGAQVSALTSIASVLAGGLARSIGRPVDEVLAALLVVDEL